MDRFGEKTGRPRRHRTPSALRKPSGGCHVTNSAPAPRANYRESNSSRLRQEIKGMTITGIVRQHGSRSKSSSPTKAYSQMGPKANNGTVTPKNRPSSPEKPMDATMARTKNASAKRARTISPDKSIDLIATPRSVSDVSSLSRETASVASQVNVAKGRVRSALSKVSAGHVVDTRSKTLTALAAHRRQTSASEEVITEKNSRTGSPLSKKCNGYGKPLVTSLNKRLTVMKAVPKVLDEPKSLIKTASRGKSPVRSIWRSENKDSVSSVPDKKLDLLKTKSPGNKVVGSKLHVTNTVPKAKPDEKVGVLNPVPVKPIRGSSTSMNKYRNKSPSRMDNKQDVSIHKLNRLCPELSQSPIRQTNKINNRQITPATIKTPQHDPKSDKKDVPSVKPCPNPRPFAAIRVPSSERKKDKPIPESFRDLLNERAKPLSCKDAPISIVGRQTSSIYSKSFKPQLEDIKSSFMLLNKNTHEQHNIKEKESKRELVSEHKPKQIKEEIRKQQLLEIRKKFQSKHFFEDSRYDKIEGLNWITWK